MIPVSDELKDAVINEVMPKSVKIDFGYKDIEGFNWYKEEYSPSMQYSTYMAEDASIDINDFAKLKPSYDVADYSKVQERDYASFSFDLKVSNVTLGDKFFIRMSFKRDNGGGSYNLVNSPVYDVSDFTDYTRITLQVPRVTTYPLLYFYEAWIVNASSGYFAGGFWIKNPQISYYDESGETPDYSTLVFATPTNISEYYKPELLPIENDNIISQSFIFKESICSADNLKFGLCEASEIQIDVFDKNYDFVGREMELSLQYADIAEKFEWKNFVIAEAKKTYTGNVQKRHIVAYDKLKNLNENAYAWYTQYMWGINMDSTDPQTTYAFDYSRQIYSTFFNLAKSFGIDSDYEKEMLEVIFPTDCPTNDRYFDYDATDRVKYCKHTVTVGNYDAYMIDIDKNPITVQYPDPLLRGFRRANICIDFHTSDNTIYQQLFDPQDVFAIPENCTTFDIYIPYVFRDLNHGTDGTKFVNDFVVYGVTFNSNSPKKLVNGYKTLPYYSFVWRNPTVDDIFKADSSITARDVMRSLMEICGCFFRLDRNGKPQFLYAMEHGLYPSNTLFPADDLFPKKSSEMTMPTSYYIKADFEEYRVSNFGGVQVVVNDFNNNGTVCRWEYWGDDSSDNAYLIDDNIFLCSSQFEYEPQMAGNIETLLENLWGVLNNMSYTPFTAEAIGTPFLESGDRFTLLTKSDGFESFIFERTLKGIQALKDTYEARGKNTPRVKTFEWNN